ncbi:MAG: RNA polymerase sigma factor [Bacteroidetes bacterium]|nr:RNA polymerase sigma factor [Bacteroidota bacterium]MBU1580243.1 RNA polymerase sigma factor [Bacteroidota bacterium]MBU2557685.1 RNA polymerase sigma factor [Bacteroidota bacterium]MDA3944423.1 RNA polymerase sigma factor [Bacteroidota bacterium]
MAETRLYQSFAPQMMIVCRRYAKNSYDAEDILQEGFIKVFRYLKDFKFNGSFEGWIRRIMITTALNFYKRKRIYQNETELTYLPEAIVNEQEVVSDIFHEEIMNLVNKLPKGYRSVFSLNSIEGYSHKEISQMLHISVNTSKSQLNRARMSLQKRLIQNENPLFNQNILQSA